MKTDLLTRLSILAHEIALQTGSQVPAERIEFMHLPMNVEAGVPVFDGAGMREDQVDDTIATLERMTRVKRAQNTREQVEEYMFTYGKFGLRKADIAEALNINEINVRRAMDALRAEGKVQFREEKTRGAGSRRKRYFWVGHELATTQGVVQLQTEETRAANLVVNGDIPALQRGSGPVHHGAWAHAVSCPCLVCRAAFDDAMAADAVSEERMAGGSGLKAQIAARKLRRLFDAAEFQRKMPYMRDPGSPVVGTPTPTPAPKMAA